MEEVRVRTTVSRRRFSDLSKFIGLPFLSPTKERLGIIIKVDEREGPWCEITILLEPRAVDNAYVRELFFPNDYC